MFRKKVNRKPRTKKPNTGSSPLSGIFWSVACLGFAITLSAQAAPLFPNSVVSNDIDFILTDDPTMDFRIIDKGRSQRELPGSLIARPLVLDGVYVMELRYKDDAAVQLWADPKFADGKAVSGYASKIAAALGKLPKAFRTKLDRIILQQGDRAAFSEHIGHFFVLYAANIDKRILTHDLEETIFHETIHATLEHGHATCAEWVKAQNLDGDFITKYAAKKPAQEDLSESALFAYTLIRHPARMPEDVEQAIAEIMPNRLEYLQKVFADLETAVQKEPPVKERSALPFDFSRQENPGKSLFVTNRGIARSELIAADRARFVASIVDPARWAGLNYLRPLGC